MGAVRFEMFVGPDAKHHFKIFNRDGSLAVTSKGYQHRDACMEAIRAVREHAMAEGNYVKKKLDGAKTAFVLQAPNRQVLVEGGPYEKPEACDEAMASVRMASQAAIVEK